MLQTEKQPAGAKETGLILGTIGSGMSFTSKWETLSSFLSSQGDTIICDPKSDYHCLAPRANYDEFHMMVSNLCTEQAKLLYKEVKEIVSGKKTTRRG